MADGAAGFGQGSSDPALLRVPARLARVPRTGLSPAAARLSRRLPLPSLLPSSRPYNPARASTPAVWAGPLSLAATRGVTLVFLSSAYLDVSVRRVRLTPQGDAMPAHGGLPHSDTCGSQAVRASPQTFAACRVLHRLREPRHPPCALARFSLECLHSLSRVCFPSILSKNRTGTDARSAWRMWGSNPRPPACKADALAN